MCILLQAGLPARAWAAGPCLAFTRRDPTVHMRRMYLPRPCQRKNGTLQLAFPSASRRWTLLAIDMAAAAAAAGGPAYAALRSVQLCSTMSVRGAFVSDLKFGLKVRVQARRSLWMWGLRAACGSHSIDARTHGLASFASAVPAARHGAVLCAAARRF